MILNTNQINKLRKLELQPLQENMRATWDRDNIWGDRFHKSADRFYGIGATYFTRVVKASVGKPVKQVIFQLRNNPNYKHIKPFKNAVDHSIDSELLKTLNEDRLYWNDVYVDDNGLIQDIKSHPNYPVHIPWQKLPDIPETQKLLEIDGVYIIRLNGIHYFISELFYSIIKKEYRNSIEDLILSDFKKIQLNTAELKKHKLQNIWR
jgi:hypothetical protein